MNTLLAILTAWCDQMGYPEPVAEFRFSTTRRWRWDACWPERKVAVELQGGSWIGGRHTRGKGYENDCEKTCEAVTMGWRVLLVTPRMVKDGRLLGWLERILGEWR